MAARARPTGDRSRARGRRGTDGFTLIELVIILALLVIASGFTLMNLEGVTDAGRLRSAGQQLADHLMFARGVAIFGGQPVYVYYDLDENVYFLTRDYYGEERDAPRHDELRHVEKAWELPRGVRLHSVVSSVKSAERSIERFDFTPLGSCVSHHAYLKGAGEEDWITVEVNGLTGRVAVHPFWKEFDGVVDALPGQ
ncbi:MAG: hypothetical protein JXQ29_07075 [Planctomycetes bacterium]|nr:hypothetical protein [Planctomycetota bacterium]